MCFCLGLRTNYSLKHNQHPLKPSLLSWRFFCLFSFTSLIRKRDTSARKLNRGQTINWWGRGEGRRRTLCAAVSLTLRTTDEKNIKTTDYVGWHCWGVRSDNPSPRLTWVIVLIQMNIHYRFSADSEIDHFRKYHNILKSSLFVTPKFCTNIVFSFSWELKWPQDKLKTMFMQNFGVTNKEHYCMLWYFL